MVQISVRPKVTLSQMSRLFIDILCIAAGAIVRTINSQEKIQNGFGFIFLDSNREVAKINKNHRAV